jgi:uncharacterized protein (DUF433 family)
MNYLNRVTIDPNICHGKPCIRGMRWPVVVLLDLLASGMAYGEILEDHPELEIEDIYAALNYAVLYMNKSTVKELA